MCVPRISDGKSISWKSIRFALNVSIDLAIYRYWIEKDYSIDRITIDRKTGNNFLFFGSYQKHSASIVRNNGPNNSTTVSSREFIYTAKKVEYCEENAKLLHILC